MTGSILGTIADASGSPVPGATVTVSSTDQGVAARRIVTDATGNFVATLLPVGVYALEAEAKGFKRVKRTDIDLHVGEKLTFNLTLEVGDVAQEVVVQGDAPQVQLQNATAEAW